MSRMLERVRFTHWDQLVFVDPSERIESRKERLLFRAVRRRWARNGADRRNAEPVDRALKPVPSEEM